MISKYGGVITSYLHWTGVSDCRLGSLRQQWISMLRSSFWLLWSRDLVETRRGGNHVAVAPPPTQLGLPYLFQSVLCLVRAHFFELCAFVQVHTVALHVHYGDLFTETKVTATRTRCMLIHCWRRLPSWQSETAVQSRYEVITPPYLLSFRYRFLQIAVIDPDMNVYFYRIKYYLTV